MEQTLDNFDKKARPMTGSLILFENPGFAKESPEAVFPSNETLLIDGRLDPRVRQSRRLLIKKPSKVDNDSIVYPLGSRMFVENRQEWLKEVILPACRPITEQQM